MAGVILVQILSEFHSQKPGQILLPYISSEKGASSGIGHRNNQGVDGRNRYTFPPHFDMILGRDEMKRVIG
jgi:hypothetical protein